MGGALVQVLKRPTSPWRCPARSATPAKPRPVARTRRPDGGIEGQQVELFRDAVDHSRSGDFAHVRTSGSSPARKVSYSRPRICSMQALTISGGYPVGVAHSGQPR